MLSVLVTIVCSFIFMALGRPIVIILDKRKFLNEGEQLAFSLAVGFLIVSLGVFFLIQYRFDAISMWILLAGISLISILGIRHVPWRDYRYRISEEFRSLKHSPWLGALWLSVLGVVTLNILQGLAPPSDYDSLMYHLVLPRYDLDVGYSSVPWDRAFPQLLFPSLGGNISRLALATMNDSVAQMFHGVLGALAAWATALLTLRLGFSKTTALLAALFFVIFRAVVWEMATVEVEPPLAAFSCLALLAYLIWRNQSSGSGLMIIFGLMIGAVVWTKMIGFAVALSFAGIMGYDLLIKRRSFFNLMLGPIAAILVFSPQAIKNILAYGNPLMPLFNDIFNPGDPKFFFGTDLSYGTGRGLIDLLIAPWMVFVQPMHYFDGMVAGAPYILAFLPLILLDRNHFSRWLPTLSIVGIFFVIWFWLLSQQVRFLIPILPIFAGIAAAGWMCMWEITKGMKLIRAVFVILSMLIGLNQAMFVGVYAMIRLPAAFGMVSAASYHEKTPTMRGDFFKTCSYIRNNLETGEKYYSMIQPHSYYCPQSSAIRIYFPDEARWWLKSKSPPPMTLDEFVDRAESLKLKFFLLPGLNENKRNPTAKPVMEETDYSALRLGLYIEKAVENLKPLIKSPFASVYDGPQVVKELRRIKVSN